MRVRSPKTEYHADGATREVPIFPEIYDLLLAVFEQVEPGTERALSDFRTGYNPHTQFKRIITRAGLTPWPRLWHNLRASRQSELASQYPVHTVCS